MKTEGWWNQGRSSVPGMASITLRASALVSGIGQYQVGGLGQDGCVQMARQPLGGAARETDGDRLAAAGVQGLHFRLFDDGAAIAISHDQPGFMRHMFMRKIRRDGEIEQ